jgi:hypothetical protein
MDWLVLVLMKVIGGNVFLPVALKPLGSAPPVPRLQRIALQFAAAAVCAGVLILSRHEALTLPSGWWMVALIGATMPVGSFLMWKAMSMSLVRGGLFMALMNVVPIVLSATILAEWHVFVGNPWLLVGFVLAAGGFALQVRADIREKARNAASATRLPLSFYGYAFGFKIIFGVGTWLLNVFAKTTDVPLPGFLMSWYSGALVSALVLMALAPRLFSRAEVSLSAPWSPRVFWLCLLAGLGIFINLYMQFATFQQVEQTVAQPFFILGDLIVPGLIGLLFFKEKSSIKGSMWLWLAIAVIGCLIMAVVR